MSECEVSMKCLWRRCGQWYYNRIVWSVSSFSTHIGRGIASVHKVVYTPYIIRTIYIFYFFYLKRTHMYRNDWTFVISWRIYMNCLGRENWTFSGHLLFYGVFARIPL